MSWHDAEEAARRRKAAASKKKAAEKLAAAELQKNLNAAAAPFRSQIDTYVNGFVASLRASSLWPRVRRSMRTKRNRWEDVPVIGGTGIHMGHEWRLGSITVRVTNKPYLIIQPAEPVVAWKIPDNSCQCTREYSHTCYLMQSGFAFRTEPGGFLVAPSHGATKLNYRWVDFLRN